MKKAAILVEVGDRESVKALLDRGNCMFAPRDLYVTVTKDASRYTTPALAELTFRGSSIWARMDDLDCCYK